MKKITGLCFSVRESAFFTVGRLDFIQANPEFKQVQILYDPFYFQNRIHNLWLETVEVLILIFLM